MIKKSSLTLFFSIIFLFITLVGCGVKGPPKAPLENISKNMTTDYTNYIENDRIIKNVKDYVLTNHRVTKKQMEALKKVHNPPS